MKYLCCYDISHSGRRARVSAYLQSVGYRIQESVFLVELPSDQRAVHEQQVVEMFDESSDRLLWLPVCATCFSSAGKHGQFHIDSGERGWFVV
ncbi:CRISPR-associated endonuclease Cas2 [Corynebacterium sp. HMSC073D01]|uniref:CRISPR-associated endonuclease Cas2 n=1 Tax=Corynebacterium TaxID=1716 RepID=UPI0009F1745C